MTRPIDSNDLNLLHPGVLAPLVPYLDLFTSNCLQLTSKEAYNSPSLANRRIELLKFIEQIAFERFLDEDRFIQKNPNHNQNQSYEAMPQPFAQIGGRRFTITDSTNVQVEYGSKIMLLKGASLLTHLAIDSRYAFALDQEGLIYQWDYQEGTLIKTIPTKGKKGLNDDGSKPLSLAKKGHFFVADSELVLLYSHSASLEIIPYDEVEKTELYTDPNLSLSHKMEWQVIKSGKMVFVAGEKGELFALDRKAKDKTVKQQSIFSEELLTTWTAFSGKLITASTTTAKAISLNTQTKAKTIIDLPFSADKVYLFGNDLLGCLHSITYIRDLPKSSSESPTYTLPAVSIFSLETGEIVQTIQDIGSRITPKTC